MTKPQTMAPREARTFNDVCRLQTDNHSVGRGWIMWDGGEVSLVNQINGESSTGTVTFSRREFDALVRWWGRQQKIRAK